MQCNPRPDTHQSAIVILGASGDLAQRKLLPALSKLYEKKEIDDTSIIIGSGRSVYTDEQFRARIELPEDFANQLFYYQGITGLKSFIEQKGSFNKIIVFMALPPSAYVTRVKELSEDGFGKETILIIEKPFGYNFESAQDMNNNISSYFKEEQIYRIDHYLAKEAVQNMLVFRYANSIFEPIWNNHYIESIQINAFEQIGVEDRGAYFDGAGTRP